MSSGQDQGTGGVADPPSGFLREDMHFILWGFGL